jgi:hypothetical protein
MNLKDIEAGVLSKKELKVDTLCVKELKAGVSSVEKPTRKSLLQRLEKTNIWYKIFKLET